MMTMERICTLSGSSQSAPLPNASFIYNICRGLEFALGLQVALDTYSVVDHSFGFRKLFMQEHCMHSFYTHTHTYTLPILSFC